MADAELYFLIIVIIVYIILILSTIGLIWGYLLSIRKIRASIDQNMRTKQKGWYWFLNFLYWLLPLSVAAAFYFFTVWYVMNPQAQQYWFPPPSTNA